MGFIIGGLIGLVVGAIWSTEIKAVLGKFLMKK